MKTKIFLFMSLFMGLFLASCNDDDEYYIASDPIMGEDSVITGSADVTATSATLHATVKGLDNMDPASYAVGFMYGYTPDALVEEAGGSLEGNDMTAGISGLTNNTTLYYQAFVTLQKKVTYLGEVKSLVTTDAKVTTVDALNISQAGATVGGSVADAPAGAGFGFVIAAEEAEEAVRGGLMVPAGENPAFAVDYRKLAPNTTYYYAAYADLGTGVVYGDVKSFTTSKFDLDFDNELVDLGLSVKWAKFNVGAASGNELGGLFGYGDVTGVKNSVDPADYVSENISGGDNDPARYAWGRALTVPTQAQFEELFNSCSKEWTTVGGVAGYKLTAPNGNSIFLPAAGSRVGNEVKNEGVAGVYATGSINEGNSQFALAFRFDAGAGGSRTSAPTYEALSIRPVTNATSNGYVAKLTCYGADDAGWNDAGEVIIPDDENMLGTYTVVTTASVPRAFGQVYVIDIEGFAAAYPKAFVRVDAIKADGNEVKFDASKFYYGDLEGNGNYRVELANIWGKGHNDAWNGLADSPFRPGGGEVIEETNLAFSNTFEVTFTVVSVDNDGTGVYSTEFNVVSNGWAAQLWSHPCEGKIEVVYDDGRYKINGNATSTASYTHSDASFGAGVIMNFFQTNDLYKFFPGATAVLDKIAIDGTELTGWDASKLVNTDADGGGVHHRLELYNCYGATRDACAFGVRDADSDNLPALGFTSKIEQTMTFKSLYANPW